METHVDEGSPLGNYLEATGEREWEWQELEDNGYDISPPLTPPRDFAPRGFAKVRRKFRDRLAANPVHLDLPNLPTHLDFNNVQSHACPIFDILQFLHKTVTSSIDHARSIGFLERLRLAIVQSQLLDNPLTLGYHATAETSGPEPPPTPSFHGITTSGAVSAAVFGFGVAALVRWYLLSNLIPTWRRLAVSGIFLLGMFFIVRAYVRREVLRNIQRQGLVEATTFFALSRDFDGANSAALNFIMEVELVSRGYRLSTPIPPISRLENNGQNIKCMELRQAVRAGLTEIISTYYQTAFIIWGYAEQTELLQLQSQYQFSAADVVQRYNVFSAGDIQSGEKLQSLKDATYLFHDIRKVFLSGLLAFHVSGQDATDRLRFTTILEALKELNMVTKKAYDRVRNVLTENDYQMNRASKPPRSPISPGRDRWQHQIRRLGAMTMNIRSVQAKLHLLREESDKALNEASDITEMGPLFKAQYESIGQDLRDLMEAWQSGKKALQSGIDRNEKRISSIGSVMMSPTSTLSGRTIAGDESSTDEIESGVEDALKKLNGEDPTTAEPEVFEAISVPRPRSMLNREERIARRREELKAKESAKADAQAQRAHMHELRGVLKEREARGRFSL
ncbi:Mysoin-binding motif of peroxisomes-domain-containing protein [Xylariaceae sp. FL0255]|nr:Mysoin-binding motif of peroxisomes-domain-containing protein [Xylariaceae sp. FL0255]